MGGTLMVLHDEPVSLLYALPFNWLLYYVPAWILAATIGHFRRK